MNRPAPFLPPPGPQGASPKRLRLRRAAAALAAGTTTLAMAQASLPDTPVRHECLARLTPMPAERPACLFTLERAALKVTLAHRWERADRSLRWQRHPETTEWTDAADGSARHTLLGALPGPLWVLLVEQRGRRPRFELVNGTAGSSRPVQRWAVPALPVASPDGRWLLVVDDGHGQGPAVVALWQRMTVGGTASAGGAGGAAPPSVLRWQQAWRYEPPAGVSYRFERWRPDGAALSLGWWHARARPGCPREGAVQLRDGPYGWDLYPAAPPDCPH